jgi:hypothetical protein
MQYRGSCHCGKVAYEVEGEIQETYSCNCSLCSRRGSLLWFAPRDKFKLLSGEADLTTYTFNKNVIRHQFCPTCGCAPFALGKDQKGNDMVSVNVRCLEGIELDRLERKPFNGRAL